MAYSTRTIAIAAASVLAVAFIVVAVLISGPLPFHFTTVNAESTHDLLVAYASKDSDSDGLPDWEEAIYGTDPNNPHSVRADLSDGEAVAQGLVKPKFATATSTPVSASSIPAVNAATSTLTDQFARALFAQYLAQRPNTGTPTPSDIATFVEKAISDFQSNNVTPNAFNEGQVHVSGTGADALVTYAASEESAFGKNTANVSESEVSYLSDAIEKNDPTAIVALGKIAKAYTATAKAYLAVPVPKEAAAPHLAVANALARLGVDIGDMAAMSTDPLRGYLGLANYEKDAPALITALTALDSVYHAEAASVPEGVPGSYFYKLLERAAATPATQP